MGVSCFLFISAKMICPKKGPHTHQLAGDPKSQHRHRPSLDSIDRVSGMSFDSFKASQNDPHSIT